MILGEDMNNKEAFMFIVVLLTIEKDITMSIAVIVD